MGSDAEVRNEHHHRDLEAAGKYSAPLVTLGNGMMFENPSLDNRVKAFTMAAKKYGNGAMTDKGVAVVEAFARQSTKPSNGGAIASFNDLLPESAQSGKYSAKNNVPAPAAIGDSAKGGVRWGNGTANATVSKGQSGSGSGSSGSPDVHGDWVYMTGTGSGSSGSGSEIATPVADALKAAAAGIKNATGPKNATAGKGNLTIIRSGLLLASNGAAEGATETDMTVTTSYSEHDLVEYGLYPNDNGWFEKPGRREDLLSNFGTDIAYALGVSRSAVKVNSIEGKKVVITMGPGAGGRPGFTYTNPSGEKEDKYVQSHPTAASLTPKGFGPLKIHFHVSGV